MIQFSRKLINSPTIMTWASLSIKILGNVLLIPLVLKKLTIEEINVWFLFFSFALLQNLIDFGFSPTFIRAFAYSKSKYYRDHELYHEMIISSMQGVYLRIGFISFAIASIIGSLILWRPISYLNNTYIGWFSWSIVVISSSINLWGGAFRVYLEGIEKIALFQYWQFLISTIVMVLNVIILLLGYGNLLSLIIISQIGLLLNVYINYLLIIKCSDKKKWYFSAKIDKKIMDFVWPAAWRSGIGVLMTYGTMQATAIFFAQKMTPYESSAYLLSLKILDIIKIFSNVPFQIKLPMFARLYAERNNKEIIKILKKTMTICMSFMVFATIAIMFAGNRVLILIGSKVFLVESKVWILLSLVYLLERIGATHIQMYSLSNVIVWHTLTTIHSLIIFSFLFSFYFYNVRITPTLLVSSFLISYSIYYTPKSIYLSYKTFNLKIYDVDFQASIIPIAIFIASSFIYLFLT